MAETYWPEIKAMEARLREGKADELIAFIKVLETKGLITEWMLHALTNFASHDLEGYEARWEALHEFASTVSK